MAQQIIDVGAAPNDGTGDPIRTAYIKCNDNFSELYGRSVITTADDGAFDLSLSNNFSCTPTQSITLSWENISEGQSGTIILTNSDNYSITKSGNTLCDSNLLSTVSISGVYLLNYLTDGTNVYLTTSAALS